MDKALVVQPNLYVKGVDYDYQLAEIQNLTKSLNLEIGLAVTAGIKKINPAYFLGKGFVDKLKLDIELNDCKVLIINYDISPIQQRNLEVYLNCKVLDRTNLIINIFALRAVSSEGKLQAELAMLLYQKSRLVKAWSHLERQRGGGGFIGGPGETQKELDKRMINAEIEKIKQQLSKLKQNRSIQKNKRNKQNYKTVALVGYTNSGKSTLFNLLTKSNVIAKDLLFATLDPTARGIFLDKNIKIVLVDTVGFVSNLPHQLVESFHSTLDVILDADFIIHVIDISSSNYTEQIASVKGVLKELNFTEHNYSSKTIEVYNKIDKLSAEEKTIFTNLVIKKDILLISATELTGIAELKTKILNLATADYIQYNIKVDVTNYALLSFIDKYGVSVTKQHKVKFIRCSFCINSTYKNSIEELLKI